MDQKEIAMNGAGVAELGFPMWPQFDPKTKQDMADALDSGLVSYWTGKKGMEFEEKFRPVYYNKLEGGVPVDNKKEPLAPRGSKAPPAKNRLHTTDVATRVLSCQ